MLSGPEEASTPLTAPMSAPKATTKLVEANIRDQKMVSFISVTHNVSSSVSSFVFLRSFPRSFIGRTLHGNNDDRGLL